jgi:hypothetical protein
MEKLMPVFDRYARLYGYVRVLRATRERLADEPGWMTNIRAYLARLSDKRKSEFGKPI